MDIAQVFFAAFVGTTVIPLDARKVLVVTLYLVLSILFWYLSVVFAERGKI